jgi:hypothetical protein
MVPRLIGAKVVEGTPDRSLFDGIVEPLREVSLPPVERPGGNQFHRIDAPLKQVAPVQQKGIRAQKLKVGEAPPVHGTVLRRGPPEVLAERVKRGNVIIARPQPVLTGVTQHSKQAVGLRSGA